MTFEQAFYNLKTGTSHSMRLPHWGLDVEIMVQRPDENSFMSAPYLYVDSRYGRVPWIPTQIEMFSDRWEVR